MHSFKVKMHLIICKLETCLRPKGVDLTGLFGEHKRSGVRGRAPVGGLGDKVPQWGPGTESR